MPQASQLPLLPIDALVPDIISTVERNSVTLLQAEPGAGKTTRVPPALLKAGFGQVYVLEPRRLAARLAARRVASEWGEQVGGAVGYQVRFEQFSSARTQLWYLTEGVLTRRLLTGGSLRAVKVVVLDEFHERHLETDLALALLRRLQASSRPDLRLLLMSATLAGDELAAKLGNPPVLHAPGRVFPVAIRYTPHSALPLEQQVASAVEQAAKETSGHMLVFLPGAAEIRKAMEACEPIARRTAAKLLPLHGDLGPEQQDLAVGSSDKRKIICSSNVAESAVTIEGVEAVIDSGLARVLTHSPWSGLSRLHIEKISKSSAIQRAGRAGRTGAGVAIRLYSESDFVRRPEHMAPEILRADLTRMALELAAAGLSMDELSWLDAPAREMRDLARDLLIRLEAVDLNGGITDAGRQIAALPIHPRLACLVLQAAGTGARQEACELAAHLSETRLRVDEPSRGTHSSDLDLILSTDMSFATRRVFEQLLDATQGTRPSSRDSHALEKAIVRAFPDRIARRRGETLLLSNGASAKLDGGSLAQGEFVVAIEIDDRGNQSAPLVRVASAVKPDWLLDFFPDRTEAREEMSWNRESERVEQVNSLRYDQLVIDESRSAPSDASAAADLLAAKALEAGVERFSDAEELSRWMNRVHFAAEHSKDIRIPDNLLAISLRHLASGLTSFADLRESAKNSGFLIVLEANVPMKLIKEIAPEYVSLPNGRRAKIEYHEGRPPSVASRLQDFFGMKESPTVARGTVPLVVQLLAPNRRPVQVTTDLVSFWKTLYPQVRRELSRRYPKHAWPEVPA